MQDTRTPSPFFHNVSANMDLKALDSTTREAIAIVHNIPDGWSFFRSSFEPERGYAFSKLPPVGVAIQDAICAKQPFHSGSSLACLMRVLQFLSKQHSDGALGDMGPDVSAAAGATAMVQPQKAEHESKEKENDRSAFLSLPSDMSLSDQISALHTHWNTPMTYMEMRTRFG